MPDIVGREEELDHLRSFVAATGAGVEHGPTTLVLEGDAGIGKSTLWEAALDEARAQGLRLVAARPAEAERALAHAGLGDLFDDVLDEVLPALTTVRRRAIELALLREEETPDDVVDRRTLGVAVRDVLHLLSDRQPTLVAVDDVQWLDASSADALAFALRRLHGGRVQVLLARRTGGGAPASELEHALDHERVERMSLGPLSVGALHRFLRDRLGRTFARQTLLRIHERSGGNPFFAFELARVLDTNVDPLRPLPVRETLEELVRARLAGLSGPARDALALASATGPIAESLLRRAGVSEEALDAAAAAHVVERVDGTLRFTHPLLASVLYGDLGDKRRDVHARLAELVDDPLVAAQHRALSIDEADEDVAAALDDAARVAAGRGASAAAADLAEHALRLTPPDRRDGRYRRALAAARAHDAAGEWTRAQVLLDDLLAEPEGGALRVEALVLLAELESVDRAAALLEEALREPGSPPALRALVHCRLAWARRFGAGRAHARAAFDIAEELDDDELRVRARAIEALLVWFAGVAEAPLDLATLAQHFPAAVGGEQLVQEATLAVVNTLAPAARRGEARALLEDEHREWRERNEPRSARALWGLSWVEFWAGRWELAAAHAAHAHDVFIQYGLERPQDHLPIAVIAVHRGRLDEAREHSLRALGLAEKQLVLHPPQHMAVMGLAALWSGDRDTALDWLAKADVRAAELGWREPSVRWWSGDLAELLLELGRGDEAVQLVDAWESDARRVAREWVLGHVTRCRGLIAAAHGDVERALPLLQQAVAEHEAVGDPYGSARALLARGVVERRARQKRHSAEAIGAAVAGFEELGAATWAEKARRELASIGGRRREDGLSAAEGRVAALVAEGRTNREVAAALFLGERTVASHLTHIYAKLGVRSRTELARKVQTF